MPVVPESEHVKRYRDLLTMMREAEKRFGWDSPEIDEILDKMDVVWWKLSEAEIDLLNEGPDVGDREAGQ